MTLPIHWGRTTSYCSTDRLRLESAANPLSTLLRSAVERLDMLEVYGYRNLIVRIDFKAADEAPEISFERV